jgi:hypothetical protein
MKITRRQLRRLIRESLSAEDISSDDLLKILRPLKGKELASYNTFASLVPYTVAEYTPLGQQLGVTSLEEFSTDAMDEAGYGPDIKIRFESDEAMENFVGILESVGLISLEVAVGSEGHFTAKKQRQTKNPKVYARMGPRIIFYSGDYNN